jgi:arginine/lysine/ornithine decarboxylase
VSSQYRYLQGLVENPSLDKKSRIIVDYLKLLEAFGNQFPGFENEVHDVEVRIVDGMRWDTVNFSLN